MPIGHAQHCAAAGAAGKDHAIGQVSQLPGGASDLREANAMKIHG